MFVFSFLAWAYFEPFDLLLLLLLVVVVVVVVNERKKVFDGKSRLEIKIRIRLPRELDSDEKLIPSDSLVKKEGGRGNSKTLDFLTQEN